jgi:hypothetical protein
VLRGVRWPGKSGGRKDSFGLGRRSLKHLSVPEFKHEQVPELEGVVGAAVAVLGHDPLDLAMVKITS